MVDLGFLFCYSNQFNFAKNGYIMLKSWFDEHCIEIKDLLSERNLACSVVMNLSIRKTKGRYKECNRALQIKCRDLTTNGGKTRQLNCRNWLTGMT